MYVVDSPRQVDGIKEWFWNVIQIVIRLESKVPLKVTVIFASTENLTNSFRDDRVYMLTVSFPTSMSQVSASKNKTYWYNYVVMFLT